MDPDDAKEAGRSRAPRPTSPEAPRSLHPRQRSPSHRVAGSFLSNHQGKVIRLHDDGRVPADNPFVTRAGALPEIWSYGHRSLQGLAFDPETGDLWATEHGPQGGDELNRILPGRNYGWPSSATACSRAASRSTRPSTWRAWSSPSSSGRPPSPRPA